MLRSVILVGSVVLLSGCMQPMQQAAVPTGSLPVVPMEQRLSEETLKTEYDRCVAGGHFKPKTSEMCLCFYDMARVNWSRSEFSMYRAAKISRPDDTESALAAAPTARLMAAECVRRVQPY